MTDRDTDKNSDNWRFSNDNLPINQKTLDNYIQKHGVERTLGYLEAIADIRAEIAWMLDSWKPVGGGVVRSPSKTQVMLKDFEKHKIQLIEHATNHPSVIVDEALILKLKQK